MEHVLLLNNAFYVDSIKNTWAKGGGHHRDTMGNLLKAAGASPVQIWSCLIIRLTVGHPERDNI